MKNVFCLLLLCPLLLPAFSQELVLEGTITDADTLMVVLRGADRTDTAITTNGRFTIRRELEMAEMFTLICVRGERSFNALRHGIERDMRKEDGVARELFLESGKVEIQCAFAQLKRARVYQEKQAIREKYDDFRKRFDPLVKMARYVIDKAHDTGLSAAEISLCVEMSDKVNQVQMQVSEKYVLENTDNIAGAYVFFDYLRRENNARKLDSIYQLFPPSLHSSYYMKDINSRIQRLKQLGKGKPAPLFSSITNEGKAFKLADLKGKYVVLDFWGSWCHPCMKGLPRMKEYYQRYRSHVEFVGIACKDDKTTWTNTIKEQHLPWTQLLNNNASQDLALLYNVLGYPTKVIIDRNGNLLETFSGESDDFYDALKKLAED